MSPTEEKIAYYLNPDNLNENLPKVAIAMAKGWEKLRKKIKNFEVPVLTMAFPDHLAVRTDPNSRVD